MSAWQWNLVVGSLGLVMAAAFAGVVLWGWRRQPVHSYRLVVTILVATLILPVGQFLAQHTGLSRLLPFENPCERLTNALTLDEDAAIAGDRDGAQSPDESGELWSFDTNGAYPRQGSYLVTTITEVAAQERVDATRPEIAYADLALLGAADLTLLSEEEAALVSELRKLVVLTDEAAAPTGALVLTTDSKPVPRVDQSRDTALTGLLSKRQLGRILATAAVLYLVGLVFSLGRMVLRVRRANQLWRRAVLVQDRDVLAVWNALVKRSPLRGRVELRVSAEIQSPMCFGLSKPVVFLPQSNEPPLAPEVLSCVLLHELVHLERGDTWTMLGQEILRSFFWFHPAAWWLCKRIDLLREISCDLLVVRRTGRRKRYASALVEYAAWMRRGVGIPQTVPSTALLPWTTSNSQLSRRIEMLVSLSSVRRGSRRATIFAAGAAFSVLWGGQLALAAAATQQDEPAQVAQDTEVEVDELEELLDDLDLAEILDVVQNIEIPDLDVAFQDADLHAAIELLQSPGIMELIEEPVMVELLELPDMALTLEMLGGIDFPELASVLELNGLVTELEGHAPELLQLGSTMLEYVQSDGSGGGVYSIELPKHGRGHGYSLYSSIQDDDSPMIGVRVSPETSPINRIVIEKVMGGSLAERAGIQADDVIIRINGKEATWEELKHAKKGLIGGKMNLSILRDGGKIEVVVRGKNKEKIKAKGKTGCAQCDDAQPFVWFGPQDDEVKVDVRVLPDDDGSGHVRVIEFDDGDGYSKKHTIVIDGDGEVHYAHSDDDHEGYSKGHTKRFLAELKGKLAKVKASKGKVHFSDAHDSVRHEAEHQYKKALELHSRHFDASDMKKRLEHALTLRSDANLSFEHALKIRPHVDLSDLRLKLEGLPEDVREHVHRALEGIHSEGGNVYRVESPDGRLHEWHEQSGSRSDLEDEIHELRARMKDREQELKDLRKKLEKLHKRHTESDRSSDNDNRHFEWRRSEDQAMLVPRPSPRVRVPVAIAPRATSPTLIPRPVRIAVAPRVSSPEPMPPRTTEPTLWFRAPRPMVEPPATAPFSPPPFVAPPIEPAPEPTRGATIR